MTVYSPRSCLKRARHWIALAEEGMGQQQPTRLVHNWKSVLKRSWSVRLAVLCPLALEAVWEVLSAAPPEIRAFIRLPVFVLLGAAAIGARIWNQDR